MRLAAAIIVNIGLFIAASRAHAAEATGMRRFLPPDEQVKLREERSLTVGVPLVEPYNLPGHFQWRPTGGLLLGAGYDASLHGAGTQELTRGYTLHAHQHSGTAYVQYYPAAQSGFYLGIGGETRFGTVTIDKAANAAAAAQLAARGSYKSWYAGPAVGFTWIWGNGITFGFDATKRKRLQGTMSLKNVLPDTPASLAGEAAAKVTPDTVVGSVMLGYSF